MTAAAEAKSDDVEEEYTDDTANIATTLGVVKNAYIFQIPPKASAMGHTADAWPKKSMWVGRLKIVSTATQCTLLFEHIDTDKMYLSIPINNDPEKPTTIDPCFDSSRYFALTIIKPGTESNPQYFEIGLGFQTREESMDFKMGVQEFERMKQNLLESQQFALKPKENFALADDEVLDIKPMKGAHKTTTTTTNTTTINNTNNASSLFMPPPSDAKKKKKKKKKKKSKAKTNTNTSTEAANNDEFFGDFESFDNNNTTDAQQQQQQPQPNTADTSMDDNTTNNSTNDSTSWATFD